MGTKVTCEDTETGESASRTIENDYCLVTDGSVYLYGIVRHANGTTILTLKAERKG